MMKSLAELGHEVSLAAVVEPSQAALNGLELRLRRVLQQGTREEPPGRSPSLTPLQERFRSYWGIEPAHILAVGQIAATADAEVVVGAGLEALPYLAGVEGPVRVWYAADEWVWHHLSQARPADSACWENLKSAAVKGLYERVFASVTDRIWVVSEVERRAMRWVTGVREVDVLPNGVDGELYHPIEGPCVPRSAVFWGRLDFGPNIQALEWFCRSVWPLVRRQVPDARFTIYGINVTPPVTALVGQNGVDLVTDLPDLRAAVSSHALVVLPFVSGGGIKNKLLEAASLGLAILATPRALGGLRGGAPVVTARRAADWVREILDLWADPERRRRVGAEARQWVLQHHTWHSTAKAAVAALQACASPGDRRGWSRR